MKLSSRTLNRKVSDHWGLSAAIVGSLTGSSVDEANKALRNKCNEIGNGLIDGKLVRELRKLELKGLLTGAVATITEEQVAAADKGRNAITRQLCIPELADPELPSYHGNSLLFTPAFAGSIPAQNIPIKISDDDLNDLRGLQARVEQLKKAISSVQHEIYTELRKMRTIRQVVTVWPECESALCTHFEADELDSEIETIKRPLSSIVNRHLKALPAPEVASEVVESA